MAVIVIAAVLLVVSSIPSDDLPSQGTSVPPASAGIMPPPAPPVLPPVTITYGESGATLTFEEIHGDAESYCPKLGGTWDSAKGCTLSYQKCTVTFHWPESQLPFDWLLCPYEKPEEVTRYECRDNNLVLVGVITPEELVSYEETAKEDYKEWYGVDGKNTAIDYWRTIVVPTCRIFNEIRPTSVP